MNIKKIFIPVVLMILGALSACSGVSQTQHSGPRAIVDFKQIEQEYEHSVAKLQWPDKYKAPRSLQEGDTSGQYQEGYGDTRASQYYECAWARQWLDTYDTDDNAAQVALKHLQKVPTMGFMSPSRADDATRRFFKGYLQKAQLGDPSGFREEVTLNCPEQ